MVVRDGNRLRCNPALHRDDVELYLQSIGVKDLMAAAGVQNDAPVRWTGVQSASTWRRQLPGDELRTAVDTSLLVRRERALIAADGAPGDIGTLPAVAIDSMNDSMVVVAGDDSIAIVEAETAAGYELNSLRLGELVRRALRCERSLAGLPIDGAFDLGPVVIGAVRIRPFLITRPVTDSAAVERTLSALAGQERWVSIHLPGANTEKWTSAFPLPSVVQLAGLRPGIIRLLRLESQVQAVELANGERLVVDTVNHLSWLDGVQLELADSERLTLELLATASSKGQSIGAPELGGAAGSSDAGRQRISALKKAVNKAFPDGKAPEIVAKTRKGEGYRLAFPPYVVSGGVAV